MKKLAVWYEIANFALAKDRNDTSKFYNCHYDMKFKVL